MDVLDHNRRAWNDYVHRGVKWTVPASPAQIEAARRGELSTVVLTASRPIPRDWLGELEGARVLCLASGGGQQGPLLAAAGAQVTVADMAEEQLARDRLVADREGLELVTLQADMRDLGELESSSFDLIVHPVSNCFVEQVRPVWREAYRVLASGGALLSGFNNPVVYCYDEAEACEPEATLRHQLPFSDLEHLPKEQLERRVERCDAVEFSHTLTDQIGGQLEAGFVIAGFYEDGWTSGEPERDRWFPPFLATRALKLER